MAAQASEIQLPFKPGDRCGEFRIVKLLGHGGAGAVYEAEHAWAGARVAIKALYRKGGDYAARMALEAKTLAEIRHRHVVRVFSGGVTEQDIVWFAMDLLLGESLTAVLDCEELEIARALRFAIEIAEGVAAAHALGVIHRDLKPENVFILAPEDEVRVLDFGTAKFKRGSMQSTDRFRFIGTYAYAAPERLLGNPSTTATDVYSFGLVLYECWRAGTAGRGGRGATICRRSRSSGRCRCTVARSRSASTPPKFREPSIAMCANSYCTRTGTADRNPCSTSPGNCESLPLGALRDGNVPKRSPFFLASAARADLRPRPFRSCGAVSRVRPKRMRNACSQERARCRLLSCPSRWPRPKNHG